MSPDPPIRQRLGVTGAVQGVGFRPFVYGLARRYGLGGFVLNAPDGVTIEVEGPGAAVAAFQEALMREAPPLARVRTVTGTPLPTCGETGFAIRESGHAGARTVLVAPDAATCEACLAEMRDPDDRRRGHPFINCTRCGPRYTIIRDLPYDRARTTMAGFTMCAACRAEYEDPADRRFHAEPTCCPVCGPVAWLEDQAGARADTDDPVAEAGRMLAAGRIVAVKGLGGFHLACDAANPDAVTALRRRKERDRKPFAVMVRDVETARALAHLDTATERVLTGVERPIVLAPKRPGAPVAGLVAPASGDFGLMLPYTPLHHLLFDAAPPALVMTSGNHAHEPIAHENDDARERLAPLADALLLHDRPIHIRTDDSVVRPIAGAPRFLRRSRGVAPYPVDLPVATGGREILAVGPELNSAVCLTRDGQAFISHHIGDLEHLPARRAFEQAVEHLEGILQVRPGAVACDLHPGYASTRYAEAAGLPVVRVQHHHAHIASVLAEHGREGPVLGVSFDGLGWGEDASPWGGEFMVATLTTYERLGRFQPVPQPGGDAAARHPPRMAYAFLHEAFGEAAGEVAEACLPALPGRERSVLARMLDHGLNCPPTSSAGRLFDAAAALLGLCDENTFHAEAPMALEAAATAASGPLTGWDTPLRAGDVPAIDSPAIIRALVGDLRGGVPPGECAARFHETLARASVDICQRMRENTGVGVVALSGGVFANALLTGRLAGLLTGAGFEVLLNRLAPAGDGGISLGQAAVAAARIRTGERDVSGHPGPDH
jgi:hydrogenase maturation protein HypF